MPGRGRTNKATAKGGRSRQREVLRDNIQEITVSTIPGVVNCISGFIYEVVRELLFEFLRNVIQDVTKLSYFMEFQGLTLATFDFYQL
uniref:Histone H4 n=1 Tax=Myripristis murdjan TaxID=586833 RepID=A0A667X6K1_9TELE